MAVASSVLRHVGVYHWLDLLIAVLNSVDYLGAN